MSFQLIHFLSLLCNRRKASVYFSVKVEMLHNDCAAQQKVLGILIASWTGVQLQGHLEEKSFNGQNHKTYNRETLHKGTREWHLIKPLGHYFSPDPMFITSCHIGYSAMAPGQADAADFDNDIQILFEKRAKKKLARARGICIRSTQTYLNIHSRQCRTVRTACVCYANGVHLALCFH